MGDSPDELERMLSVMRYSFSNQLKFVRYKIGKPYNSTLGESPAGLLSTSPLGGEADGHMIHPSQVNTFSATGLYRP